MRLLVTRPEPAAGATARRLMALGHEVIVDPMLRIVDTGAPLPGGPLHAIAFTSVNGVEALARHQDRATLPALPTFAVGRRTAAAAQTAGFTDVTDCAGDVATLAAALSRLPPGSRVLHAAGAERAGDLEGALAPHGVTLVLAVLYSSVPADALDPATVDALAAGRLDAVLHYSPRTAQAVLRAVDGANVSGPFRNLRHLCLSQAVAAPLLAFGARAEVAERPEEDALLTLL
ncbi:uroporphyrinogen III methyltransferase [Azorhizobium oxalatiphilum]|uniref:Uroporphyrinogen III methyltransferase n=1 Tax=Azorhizobium oxalatiphilum TaxID=980631 RepID=A0A917FDB0_9HYPH|nr:uroporphyrinogen-III synthase [Azorhizobium oxalatiphilum]GGF64357.1 uroporphyrinogen III methyltransferase [Azorhizobium oxalatiphilum]